MVSEMTKSQDKGQRPDKAIPTLAECQWGAACNGRCDVCRAIVDAQRPNEATQECGALIGPEGESCGVPRHLCREHRKRMTEDEWNASQFPPNHDANGRPMRVTSDAPIRVGDEVWVRGTVRALYLPSPEYPGTNGIRVALDHFGGRTIPCFRPSDVKKQTSAAGEVSRRNGTPEAAFSTTTPGRGAEEPGLSDLRPVAGSENASPVEGATPSGPTNLRSAEAPNQSCVHDWRCIEADAGEALVQCKECGIEQTHKIEPDPADGPGEFDEAVRAWAEKKRAAGSPPDHFDVARIFLRRYETKRDANGRWMGVDICEGDLSNFAEELAIAGVMHFESDCRRESDAHHDVRKPEEWTAESSATHSGLVPLSEQEAPREAVRIAFLRGWARATDHHKALRIRERATAVASILDEIGVTIAGIEARAEEDGFPDCAAGARDCLRAVEKIRKKVLK